MNRKIDNLIKEWARQAEPTDEHLKALTQRVSGKLRYVQPEAEGNKQRAPSAFRILAPLGYTAIGALAAVVMFLYLPIGVQEVNSGSALKVAAAAAGLSQSRIATGIKLFDEMDRLFNGNLRWVSESNGDMGMGVETTPGPCDAVPALVRITVLARRGDSADWSTAWQSDVVLRGQDLVEVAPNAESANKLALWVFPLEDGKIAVDTSVSLALSGHLATQISAVIAPGETTELAVVHEDGTEYRVFQTVVLLGEHSCDPRGMRPANGGV
jgi:hypothetical protein